MIETPHDTLFCMKTTPLWVGIAAIASAVLELENVIYMCCLCSPVRKR